VDGRDFARMVKRMRDCQRAFEGGATPTKRSEMRDSERRVDEALKAVFNTPGVGLFDREPSE
jgi:hypothetical protein